MEDGNMATQKNTVVNQTGHTDITWRGTHSLDERDAMLRQAAYYIYEQRGCGHGHDVDDWLAAEAALDHDNRELRPAGFAEFEMLQSGVHGAREDDELKYITKQHPQKGIPLVESVEPQEAPSRE